MNIKMSTGCNGVKNCVIIESEGKELYSKVFKGLGSNLKKDMLMCIYKGLRASSRFVSHDDLLIIEVQNNHLVGWLNGEIGYKGYEEYIYDVFEALEGLDCRYLFVFNSNSYAKKQLSLRELDKVSLQGVDSLSDMVD